MDRGSVVTKAVTLALAVVLACTTGGFAAERSGMEKLLNVAPDDVFFVAGTSGGDEVGPAFKQTVIGKMWNDPQTQAFYTQIVDTIKARIAAEAEGNDANEVKFVTDTVTLMLSRPIIVGAAGKQAAGDLPPAYLFLMVNTGPSKDAISARFAKLEAMAPKDTFADVTIAGTKLRGPAKKETPDVYWGMAGEYFVVAVNDPNGLALKHLKSGGSSASSLLNKVKPNGDAMAVYLDIARVKAMIQADKDAGREFGKVTGILASLGLDNIRTYVARTGFAGGQFTTEAFVEAPSPHKGLLAVMKPVDMKAFDMVDANCVGAMAANIDIASAFDTVMNTIKGADADAYAEATKGITDFETQVGFKIRDGLLASLAGPVVIYNLPQGNDVMGGASAVLVADLKDQAKFEESMAALGKYAGEQSKGSLQISTQTVDGRKLNVWTIPQMAMMGLAPTWTIANGKLVMATNQQACKSAADMAASPKAAGSLSSVPAFKTVTAGLPSGLTSVRYLDAQVYFKMLNMQLQRMWPMVTMVATQNGIALPYTLPDLSKYQSQFGPGIVYSWTDKDGLHSRMQGSGIEQAIGGVAGAAAGLAVLMPALAKTKDLADQMLSATNMKGMANAILVYAQDHKDQYPGSLDDLVKEAGLSPSTLEYKRKPKDLPGPSYYYVAGLKESTPSSYILIYENPGYRQDKINVLYNDMHVEWVSKGKFKTDLKKTYEGLGQPVPAVKFMGEKPSNGKKKAASKPAEPNKPQVPGR